MGFIPLPWNIGDKITKSRLDRLEQGISDADITVPGSPAAQAASTTYVPLWKANTAYAQGQFALSPTGQTIQAVNAFTSGSSYDASKWTVVGGGNVLPGAARNALTGWFHADGFGADISGTTAATNAVQAAVNAIVAAGGSGKLYLPAGTYRLGSIDFGGCNGVEIFGAARGATIIKAPTGLTNTLSYIFGATSACSELTFRDMTFVGTAVDDATGPRRARTYTGYGFNSAIRFTGDLSGSGPVISDLNVSNVEVIGSGGNDASGNPTYSGLPVFFIGIRGHAKIEKSRFYNTLDVGFTFCESVICADNVSIKSADNGFSLSRGNQSITAVGNRVVGAAYNGIWVSGFNTDTGPTDFTVTGNVIKNIGYCGVIADGAPRGGVISSNLINGGYNRGPSDGLTDSYGSGVYVGSSPAGSTTPTAYAQDVLIVGNTIRNMPRAGVAVHSGKNIKVTGNHIIDVGTQYLADGATAIASTDSNQNIGVLFINSTLASTCTVDGNSIIDQRGTAYLNYGIRPQAAPAQSNYVGNAVQGARNVYDFIETVYSSTAVRRFAGITQFDSNVKLPGGATAGSNTGGGAALGLDINGAAGNIRPVRWLTASSERWRLYANTTAEAGSNVGSDLVLEAKSDAGTALSTVLTIARSTGVAAFTASPTVPTATAGDSSTKAASTAYVAANSVSLTEPSSQQLAADGVSLASPWQEFATRSQRPASKVVFRFNGTAGFTTSAKVTEDTSTVLFGDRTMKLAAVAGDNIATDSPVFTAQDWSTSTIRLWLKMDTPANWSQSVMYVYMTGGGIASVGITANFQAGEWIAVTIPRVQFSTAAGTLDWTKVTKITVTNVAAATGPISLWLGGVDLVPDLASTYPAGVMVCEMDDGFAGQFTYGLPVFASRGIPVTYNVIGSNFVGSPSATGKYAADLRTLQDVHGWQISCHAYSATVHAGPSTNAQLEVDFQRQKQWLHANGLHAGADHYALCPGTGSPVPAGALMDALRKSFRSVRVNSGYYETAAYADPLRLRSVLFSGAGNNVTNVKANIDKAAGAGGAFIFAMHDVIAGATDGTSGGIAAIAQTNLATILDYAASKGMVFRTRSDLIDGR